MLPPAAWLVYPGQRGEVRGHGEPFRGKDISMKSLADLILRLFLDRNLHVRENLGVRRG